MADDALTFETIAVDVRLHIYRYLGIFDNPTVQVHVEDWWKKGSGNITTTHVLSKPPGLKLPQRTALLCLNRAISDEVEDFFFSCVEFRFGDRKKDIYEPPKDEVTGSERRWTRCGGGLAKKEPEPYTVPLPESVLGKIRKAVFQQTLGVWPTGDNFMKHNVEPVIFDGQLKLQIINGKVAGLSWTAAIPKDYQILKYDKDQWDRAAKDLDELYIVIGVKPEYTNPREYNTRMFTTEQCEAKGKCLEGRLTKKMASLVVGRSMDMACLAGVRNIQRELNGRALFRDGEADSITHALEGMEWVEVGKKSMNRRVWR